MTNPDLGDPKESQTVADVERVFEQLHTHTHTPQTVYSATPETLLQDPSGLNFTKEDYHSRMNVFSLKLT